MVSFDLSEEQMMIRETVGVFARDEVRPAARIADESGAIPPALIAKSWELGLVRGAIPEQFGGYGDARSAVTGAIVAEELAFGDLSIAIHMLAPRLAAYPLIEFGTDEQRARLLKNFARDEFTAGSAALMEPRFDFDAADLATRAERAGAGYVLNGTKCYVPLGAESEWILVYAACGSEAGGAGVGGFIVPRGAPGLVVAEREQNMGLKGLATYEVTLENCRLGAEARIGGEGGLNFTRIVAQTRVAAAAMATGVARAAYEYARAYAKERKAFGVPIATKQAIAFMLAEMAIEVDAMRLLTWEAAAWLDKGEDALKESYQARNYAAQAALVVTDNAVQTLGGHGYIREHPVELFLRNARGFAVLEGLATV
ncbi:MAG TPA: acyl-CoA dehydrogenase family protein [Candidatus Binataceae bacterium]|nr:acyl-CoA dehydrogenase family protein [Candidatus Binataceae bacterium]